MFAVLTLIVYRICGEHPSKTINQSPCNGGCDGNPIYANHEHTKQRVRERILGSRAQFCAAFYHVHKWNRHRKRFCLAPEGEDNCIIAIRASSENNWKLQPKTVVAMVKYEKVVNGNSSILYEAKYTNCQREKKHAEDFFKEDVEGGNLGNITEQHREGTITMYLTLQPCNRSTTTDPEGTALTSPNKSCCETLRDIFTDRLQENGVELCVKPTHLCRIDHHAHSAVHNDSEQAKNKYLRDNAETGIQKLMEIKGVTVNAMTEDDWDYLLGMAEFDVLQYIDANADGVERRKKLDEEIGEMLKEIRLTPELSKMSTRE